MGRMTPLEGLLQLCDEIGELQARHAEGTTGERISKARERVQELRGRIFEELPVLDRVAEKPDLDAVELLVLALLFHRRLGGSSDPVLGSTLIGLLSQAGVERSEALRVLGPGMALRRERWVRCRGTSRDAFDPLDLWFHASPRGLGLFWQAELGNGGRIGEEDTEEARPYREEEEYLWDLYAWRNHCLARAEALFPVDTPGGPPSPRLRRVRGEARAAQVFIRRRVALTPGRREFAIERFRRAHHLDQDELLVIVHLLFSELVEGEPYISAIECLRVLAETRDELFLKRSQIGPRGRLRREGILVAAESNDFAKALAVDLTLADWAADEFLAGVGRHPHFDDRELDDFLKGDD